MCTSICLYLPNMEWVQTISLKRTKWDDKFGIGIMLIKKEADNKQQMFDWPTIYHIECSKGIAKG